MTPLTKQNPQDSKIVFPPMHSTQALQAVQPLPQVLEILQAPSQLPDGKDKLKRKASPPEAKDSRIDPIIRQKRFKNDTGESATPPAGENVSLIPEASKCKIEIKNGDSNDTKIITIYDQKEVKYQIQLTIEQQTILMNQSELIKKLFNSLDSLETKDDTIENPLKPKLLEVIFVLLTKAVAAAPLLDKPFDEWAAEAEAFKSKKHTLENFFYWHKIFKAASDLRIPSYCQTAKTVCLNLCAGTDSEKAKVKMLRICLDMVPHSPEDFANIYTIGTHLDNFAQMLTVRKALSKEYKEILSFLDQNSERNPCEEFRLTFKRENYSINAYGELLHCVGAWYPQINSLIIEEEFCDRESQKFELLDTLLGYYNFPFFEQIKKLTIKLMSYEVVDDNILDTDLPIDPSELNDEIDKNALRKNSCLIEDCFPLLEELIISDPNVTEGSDFIKKLSSMKHLKTIAAPDMYNGYRYETFERSDSSQGFTKRKDNP
jgi:hypothetical protein